ncbi:OmpA family protein [Hyalangium versicolor]|uniref:OmpA family protein n=1 Tax=Hyalangium versicolor TaxID=2861190 RepID=UPI001CD02061|nr:OmpA family protein [Hyalangium versicolor]
MHTNLSARIEPTGSPASRSLRAALLALCCVIGTACEQTDVTLPPKNQTQSLAGTDGDFTVTEPNTVLNRYAVLATDAQAGATSVQVAASADLNDPNFGVLAAGDLVFFIQMQGASTDTSDSPNSGAIPHLNSADLHEFAIVSRVEGNVVHLACSGLRNSYTVEGRTQVVRVPRLNNLTVNSGGSVVAKSWDGQSGGVVVLHVNELTSLAGTIDVSGQGFRAGADGGSGGIVYLTSTRVNGSGAILANGGNAKDTTPAHDNAPSGGGSGGTVVVLSSDLADVSVSAHGGSGGATAGASGQVFEAPATPQPWLACTPVDLSVTVTDDLDVSIPGVTSPYTVIVTNAGPGIATDAPISVTMPPDASGASWTCTASGGASCAAASGTGPISSTITVPPGGTVTFNYNVTLSEMATVGNPEVTATVSAPTTCTDNTPGNNTATDTNTIQAESQMSIMLTDSPDPAEEDKPLTYSARPYNGGPNYSGLIKVTFDIPSGTTFSNATGPGWSCSNTATQVICTYPNQAPNGGVPVSIVVIPTIETGTLNASVYIEAQTDSSPEDNTDSATTQVNATNDPPTNNLPGTQTTPEDTPLVLSPANGNSISIYDTDAGDGTLQVTLTITHGTLTLGGTSGLTFTVGDGASDTTMTFTGNMTDINAAIATMTFTPDANYFGEAYLTIVTNDQGNTGPDGPKTDTDTLTIIITPVNDPPTAVDDTLSIPGGTKRTDVNVLDNDSFEPDADETLVVIEVTQGNQGGTVTIVDGGARVEYVPVPGFAGPETFTYTISDGNGGTATATVTITVGELHRRVVGRGCSASDESLPSAFWMLLALVSLTLLGRRSARASSTRGISALFGLGAVAVLAASSPAQAQSSTAIDVQQFKPAPGKADVLGLHGPGVPGHLSWRAGLFLNYAHDPLVVVNSDNDDLLQHLVKNQLGFDLMGAVGLGKRFELGAALPLNLQHGEFNESITSTGEQTWKGGLGDLRLVPKALLLDRDSVRLALVAPVVLPTGGSKDLHGQKGVGVQPRVAADYTFEGGTRLLANVGVNVRSRQELLNLSVGNELTYGFGAAIPFQVQGQPVTALASLAGALGLGATGGTDQEEIPLELQAAIQYRFSKEVLGTVGLGRGMTLGYGMPVFRVFTGLVWTVEQEPRSRVKDSDGDGLVDFDDDCPDDPEDKDGFQDDDGCPDLDNDQDGIPDTLDKCPLVAEDKDGFQDDDGCPEPDNDQDGIPDTLDKCPLEAEDKDGFQDTDGCPDLDNDQDGIVDTADKCPMQPEDKDGFQDQDGCPDPDNDRDGVDDAHDQCPTEPETINGVDDADGCPDKGKPQVEVQGRKIVILEKVYFATNKDVVLARSFPLLQQVGQVLRGNSQITKVRVEGHTDDRGENDFNMDLSQRRANNVRKFLVEQAGIAPERLEAVGYGETQPVDTNKTDQGRENNRRVVFTILEIDGESATPP